MCRRLWLPPSIFFFLDPPPFLPHSSRCAEWYIYIYIYKKKGVDFRSLVDDGRPAEYIVDEPYRLNKVTRLTQNTIFTQT